MEPLYRRLSLSVEEGMRAIAALKEPIAMAFLSAAAKELVRCFNEGNKVLIAGNGGSLCDAIHFAEELTGFFRSQRPALAAIALSDPGHITCVGNDVGFDQIFSRAIEALGSPGDLFIGLTTSGNSTNLLRAFSVAKERGLETIAFLGRGGGALKGVAAHELIIDGFATSDRIQEAHMAALHILVEAVEELLWPAEEQVKTCATIR